MALDNKLLLNLGKTESIYFCISKHKLQKISKFAFKVRDYVISAWTTINYLGCVLDNSLSGASTAIKSTKQGQCKVYIFG